jgi:hypothetical protein
MDTFTARTPVDLLAIVPYVIGFHPEDSVVMLTFGEVDPSGVGPASFHARIDLPVTDAERRGISRMLRDVVTRNGARSVGLIVYSSDADAARLFADLMTAGLEQDDVEVIDAIRVDGGRFYPACDLDDPGTPYDLSSHPFTASQVFDGRRIYESRSALRESLMGADDDDSLAVGEAANALVDSLTAFGASGGSLSDALVDQARWLQSWLAQHLQEPAPLEVADAARLIVLVSFEAVREVVWAPMTRSQADAHVELWRGLVRRAPADLLAGVSGLLAFAAWLAGDGALAWCAIDRSLEARPDDLLAQHAAALVKSAVAPAVWAPAPAESLRIFTAFGPGAAVG